MPDYYTILGIEKSASKEEIKSAYRKLASLHHPDRGGDTKTFQEIQAAYATLSDPDKKLQYDNYQNQTTNNHFQDISDIFRDFFNFENNNVFRREFRNKNLNLKVEITLEEAFNGKDIISNVKLPSGRDQLIDIKIPKGIQHNTTLRIYNIGDDSIKNIPRGDIFLTVDIKPHPIFKRLDDDLETVVQLSCFEAILGKELTINTIDNKTLAINIPPGAQNNQIFGVPNFGMFNNSTNTRGRLFIKINITIPTNLTDEQKAILKNFI
jgi:curved DNA-binding protein